MRIQDCHTILRDNDVASCREGGHVMGTWLSAVRWAEVRIPNHVGDNLATAKEVIDFFAVV